MSKQTPFEVLGILPSAETEVIQAAYRALARRYHPDLNPATSAAELTQKMSLINWAREELETRHSYWLEMTRQATGTSHTASANQKAKQADPSASGAVPRHTGSAGSVSVEPAVLHMTGSRGMKAVIRASAPGARPADIKARYRSSTIRVEKAGTDGSSALFAIVVVDEFRSNHGDSMVDEIEFFAPGYVSSRAYVAVAPVSAQVIGQRYGGRIAPPRHVSASARISFGKYRGRPFREIAVDEPHYLEWVLKEGAGSRIERSCAKLALDGVRERGSFHELASQPANAHGRLQSSHTEDRSQELKALPDPHKSGSLTRLLKGIFGSEQR